jgi:5-methyltetrahydropteroyltriglutamate--homocysteine methyltransferase
VIEGIEGLRLGIHVCRGNWSKLEEVLLAGDYTPLLPAFAEMKVQQYVLEYATPRAGEIAVVGQALNRKELGLGVVNPRTDEVESREWIISRVEQALEFYPPEAIFLNPDCGFGCFANRCVNDEQTAFAKMRRIVEVAQMLRERY